MSRVSVSTKISGRTSHSQIAQSTSVGSPETAGRNVAERSDNLQDRRRGCWGGKTCRGARELQKFGGCQRFVLDGYI